MPWRPLPRIAFAVAIYPFQPSSAADLPLELGDELYIIEQGGVNGEWCRGYLVAPPSLLAGLTSNSGQALEARVFSGIFPRNCVEIREVLGDADTPKVLPANGTGDVGDGKSIASAGDRTSSVAIECEVSDVVIAKKGKPSQIFIHHKLEVDEDRALAQLHQTSSSSLVPPAPPPAPAPVDKPPAPVPMLKIGDDTPTSLSEPLVDEIASCLREWHSTNLHELLLSSQYSVLEEVSQIVQELDLVRRQLLHDVLTAHEKADVRSDAVWKLNRANKMLSGEVIVRDPEQRGRLLTGDDPAVHFTKLQSEMSVLDGQPSQPTDASGLHHLLADVNAVSGHGAGPITLAVQLFAKSSDPSSSSGLKPLSETFMLDIPSPQKFADLGQSSNLKTLFADIGAKDISTASGGIYLFVTVRGTEAISSSSSSSSTTSGGGNALHSRSSTTSSSTSRIGSGGAGTNGLSSGKGNLKTRRSVLWTTKAWTQQSNDNTANHNPNKRTTSPHGSIRSSTSTDSVDEPPAKTATSIRTIGVGLLEVSQILRQNRDIDQVVNLWSPARSGDEDGDSCIDGFDALIRALLPSPNGRYIRSPRAARLHLHLSPFVGPDADILIRENPTTLHDVMQTRRIGFSEPPTKPRSDIYVTLSNATFPSGALLSHPHVGQIPVQVGGGLHNVQLTLEVRTSTGQRLERCIFPCSDDRSYSAWRTTVARRGSPWNETIRLQIGRDQVPESHLVMSVADAPDFPFGIAWMPLWEQHAFTRDGSHSLLLHAYDKHTSSLENGKGLYMSLPWSALGKNQLAKDEAVTGPMATIRLETHLCSTEYSQDQVMLSLLNWKDRPTTEVLDTLKQVVFVPEIEIVQQLSGVFDALFGILVEHAGKEEYEDLIFTDLVTVLGIVHDRRFNLGPLVDAYVDEQFYFPFATPCLLRSYLRLLQAAGDVQRARTLRAAFKVGRHLLKFIINGRRQQKAKEEGIGVTRVQSTFNGDLHAIFSTLQALMKDPSPALVGSKTLVVQHFHTWLPELSKALSNDEAAMIALSFIDSCCRDIKGGSMLLLYTLVLIQNYTQLQIFATGQERRSLISSCVSWLAPYWGAPNGPVTSQYRDQVRLCCAVVARLVNENDDDGQDPALYEFMPHIVASYCALLAEVETEEKEKDNLSLLFSKSFPFQVKPAAASGARQKFDEALIELSAIIAAISKIPNSRKLPTAVKDFDQNTFLLQAFESHNSILNCDAYPSGWLSLHIYNHRATLKSLERLSGILMESFLPAPDEADTFDTGLWEMFFTTLLRVVSSDTLALETFPEQKRRAVWKIAGDVREQGAELLRSTWQAIGWEASEEQDLRYGVKVFGGYQVQYVPGLVSPIIELCLSVHEGLRRVAVEVLRTMMLSEWDLNHDLSEIETELISGLDCLFKTKRVNDNGVHKLFIPELLSSFDRRDREPRQGDLQDDSDDAELSSAARALLATVDELLDLLVASQSGSMTDSVHTMRLMEYMKDMGREDIFIRYVHELADMQARAGNFTEAGLALQFHAGLYDWSAPTTAIGYPEMLPPLLNPPFPEQTSFDRKENLYFAIIQHFENGKAWSHALSCYKELAEQYERTVIDFQKLSRAQSSVAKIYDAVAKEDEQYTRFFRVVYKGLGFPQSLQNRQFIFEGATNERLASFVDRMQRAHPAAQIISASSSSVSSAAASGEMKDLEGQFLQVSAVNVHRDLASPVYQRVKIPHNVREYLLVSSPDRFSVTAKRHRGEGGDATEQYIEKTVFVTADPFPNILRRSEIVAVEEGVVLTPVESAVERVWRKTNDLNILEKRIAAGDESAFKPLLDLLDQLLGQSGGAHDSNCMGIYRKLLPLPLSEKTHDESGSHDDVVTEDGLENGNGNGHSQVGDPMVNALAVALIDHALAIKRALSTSTSLHPRSPSSTTIHSNLSRRFEEVYASELKSAAPHVSEDISYRQATSPTSPTDHQDYTPPATMSPLEQRRQSITGRRRSSRMSMTGALLADKQKDRNSSSRKQSVGHRISSMNPFKRLNQGSVHGLPLASISRLGSATAGSNGNTNGNANNNFVKGVDEEPSHSVGGDHADDNATVNTTGSLSPSELRHSKRKSWRSGLDKSARINSHGDDSSLRKAKTSASSRVSVASLARSESQSTTRSHPRLDSSQRPSQSGGSEDNNADAKSNSGGDAKNNAATAAATSPVTTNAAPATSTAHSHGHGAVNSGGKQRGGWSTIPSVKDYPRPSTALSTATSTLKGPISVSSSVNTDPSPVFQDPFASQQQTPGTGTGKRESVLKRFSLLKGGVAGGRKNSRFDIAKTGMAVHEE